MTTATTVEHDLGLLRQMLRIRRFEERAAECYTAGQIRGVASAISPDVRSGLPALHSVDFQNFVIGLSRDLRVEIAARDAPQLQTLAGCVACLEHRHSAVD